MEASKYQQATALYLRLALGAAYLWLVADRLGWLGAPGQPHISWGDWAHFMLLSKDTMSFLPDALVTPLAVLATIGEGVFGFMLIIGLFTRLSALGSGAIALAFAASMTISRGIDAPIGYSVFTVSAASFLLATLPYYKWSIDSLITKQQPS
ncbi:MULTISPECIES: DoxX family protein [unclassified Mucilaginibacter]|uniref:DoxX family protein n=1 Tax=unclassified Mucilaginibacter TaxID=2617802 RepID=UPI002AC9DE45|nr:MULTISPECIES: DoxX family protein [unclassified Mucilaginibacter]MEB0263828.1 DoxX family protein [Mucilaginibacter sp. 10I4]MEB0279766.1 DoxX family protein [Mucilaginibacter sp. 10B2]MEB0301611.1 DoxX family protein [Mucilaginibacter sp. 5C4]WPX23676.1 DoxX family protein [Mucilaginibacter sp. 5C4]